MSNPKISIILPIYNAEKFINTCLNSIINQTLTNLEIICIDYGSADNSLKILNEFKEKDKRIIVFSQKHLCINEVIHFGINESKGDYILFMNISDWLEKNACETFYNQTNKLDIEILLFNFIRHSNNNTVIKYEYFPNNSFKEDYNIFTFVYSFKNDIVINRIPSIWFKFYKSSFLKEINNLSKQKAHNEILLHILTIIAAKKIGYFPNNLYHSSTLNFLSLENDETKTYEKFIKCGIFNEIKHILKNNKIDGNLETNFIMFVIEESENYLRNKNTNTKLTLFNEIKNCLIKLHIKNDLLKKMPLSQYKFYINLINSENYLEFLNFKQNNEIKLNDYETILLNVINEKNNEIYKLKKQINELQSENNILNEFYNDYLCNNDILNSYTPIKEKKLFDEDYYRYHEGYVGNINPYLHYIYQGYKDGKNPSSLFDSNYYMANNENINMNPLIHFINYGLKEGNVNIRPDINYPLGVNKIKIDEEISKINSKGITANKRKPQLIVSLTSYPKRINTIKYVLFSLLTQSLKPDKIILWLSETEFINKENDIPQDVLKLKKFGLEISWCEDIKSYKKLIPILKKYPNDIIVTIDDDIYLKKDWLEKLYEFHGKYPQYIICHRARRISFDEKNHITPYTQWNIITEENEASFLNFFTGAGGVLYPPNSLDEEVFNKELFMKLTPTSDDIWFWAMAIKKDTKIKVVKDNMHSLTYVSPEEEFNIFGDSETLWLKNSKGLNDIHLKNILKKYPEILDKIKKCDVK